MLWTLSSSLLALCCIVAANLLFEKEQEEGEECMTVRVCNTGVWMELFLTASSFSPFMGSIFSFFHLPEVLAWHPLKSSLKGNWLKIPLWENNLFLSPWQKAEFCLYCGINIICLFALRSGSKLPLFPYDGFDHYLKWDFSSTLCSHLMSRAHSKDQIPHALLNPYLFFFLLCVHSHKWTSINVHHHTEEDSFLLFDSSLFALNWSNSLCCSSV